MALGVPASARGMMMVMENVEVAELPNLQHNGSGF
jgi:hypothetical protein